MYLMALSVIIMYRIADISGMSGFLWGAITLAVNFALIQVIPVVFWTVPLTLVVVYIPLFLISLKNGPQ